MKPGYIDTFAQKIVDHLLERSKTVDGELNPWMKGYELAKVLGVNKNQIARWLHTMVLWGRLEERWIGHGLAEHRVWRVTEYWLDVLSIPF